MKWVECVQSTSKAETVAVDGGGEGGGWRGKGRGADTEKSRGLRELDGQW